MKVILQQDVKGQGKKGQLIEASDGYARNFLLPRKLAVPATAENVNTMKMQEKARKAQEAAEKAEAESVAAKLKDCVVKLTAKDVAKSKIVQEEPIKAYGTYELKCKLGYEVSGAIQVVVAEA